MANLRGYFVQTELYKGLSAEERPQALADFEAMSEGSQREVLGSLGVRAAAAHPPSLGERAVTALPQAAEETRTLGGAIGDIGLGVAQQAVGATPLNPLAQIYKTIRGPVDKPGLLDKAADVAGYQPSPKELVAQGIGMAVPMAGGAVISRVAGKAAAPYLTALAEPGLNLLARKANVEIGAEEPGAVGDVASVAVPLAVRGMGAVAKLYARKGPAGQALDNAAEADAKAMLAYEEASKRKAAVEAKAQERYAEQRKSYDTLQQKTQEAYDRRKASAEAYNTRQQEKYDTAQRAQQAEAKAYLDAKEAYQGRIKAHGKMLEEFRGTENAPTKVWGGPRAEAPARIKVAYDAVEKAGNPEIPWENVRETAREIMGDISAKNKFAQDSTVFNIAKEFAEMGGDAGNPAFSQVRTNLVGENGLGSLSINADSESRRWLGKLLSAVMGAMDAGGGEAQGLLRAANAQYRKHLSLQQYERLFTPGAVGSGVSMDAKGNIQISPKTIYNGYLRLTNLERNPLFTGAFSAAEKETLERELQRLAAIDPIGTPPKAPGQPETIPLPHTREARPKPAQEPPPLHPTETPPVPAVQPAEPVMPPRNWRALGGVGLGTGAVGGAVASITGAPYWQGIIGAEFITIGAEEVGRVLSQALLSKAGRPYLRRMLQSGSIITPTELGYLNTMIRRTPSRENED